MPDDVKVDTTDTTAADTTSTATEVVADAAKADVKVDAGKADTTKTIVDTAGDQGADKSKAAPPAWPDDWRDRLSGKDEKLLKRLTRFQSPENVFRSYVALENRLNAGELKEPLPEKATPEQTAAWREKNGIPASPDKYELKLSDGLVIGDEHKPIVDAFLKAAHEGNMPAEHVSRAVDWYFRMEQEAAQQKYDADVEFKQKSDDTLRQEWGQDYRGYVNAVANLLVELGGSADFADNLLAARMPDGRIVGNDPAVLKMLAQVAIDRNPAATVVPGAGQNSAAMIEDELGKIQKMLGNFESDYYKAGPVGDKLQARYRDLLEAKARIGERRAA